MGGTAVDEDVRIDTNIAGVEVVDKTVLEEGLGNGNKDSTAKGLEELDACSANRDPFLRKDSLDNKHTDLEARADAETRDNLVTKPFPHGGVDVEGGDHAATNGVENHARNNDDAVVSNGRDETTSHDGDENSGKQQWENLNSGLNSANTLDRLEVEGYCG